MSVQNQNYVSARIKKDTYKKLKQLALDLDVPLTRLIDIMYEHYQKLKV